MIALLVLACSSAPAPPPGMGLALCEPWTELVSLAGERVVSCGPRSLALRVEGKVATEQDARFTEQLTAHGYTLERDVSRARQTARVYTGEVGRLALSVTESRDDTTISLHVIE